MLYEFYSLKTESKSKPLSQQYESAIKQKIAERIGSDNFDKLKNLIIEQVHCP